MFTNFVKGLHSCSFCGLQVFIRELISNSSDALEKFRYMQMTRDDLPHGQPLEIHIAVDQEKSTFTIQVSAVPYSSLSVYTLILKACRKVLAKVC